MDDLMLPQRSLEGLAALDVFYIDFNEVNFFVEDIDQENLYEIILRRIFPQKRITRVFPLGGKQEVLKHLNNQISSGDISKSIYIVDKDLDDLLGSKEHHDNLFYLDRYCIENYFLEPSAIIDFIIENAPKTNRQDVAAREDFAQKVQDFGDSLKKLFLLFLYIQRNKIGIRNCSLPAENFCQDKKRWIIDEQKISNYLESIKDHIRNNNFPQEHHDPLSLPDISSEADNHNHILVSGKYICTLLFHYLKSKYQMGSLSFESFTFRLAKNSSLEELQPLASAIKNRLSLSNA